MLPEDLLKEAIPGNIRKAEHFVAFLKRFVEYLKVCGRFIVSMSPCSADPSDTRFVFDKVSLQKFSDGWLASRRVCVYCTLWPRRRYRSFST